MKHIHRAKNWIKNWAWVIAIAIVVISAVIVSYQFTENASPLDAVESAGSLLLSVLLIYIYTRQNKILETQEQIFDKQKNIQEATTITPELEINTWRVRDSSIWMSLKNIRSGDAYNLSIGTKIEIVTEHEDVSLIGTDWRLNAGGHIRGYAEDESFEQLLRFSIVENGANSQYGLLGRITRLRSGQKKNRGDDETSYSFSNLSTIIVKRFRKAEFVDPVEVRLSIYFSFTDSTGNPYKHQIIDQPVKIRATSDLRSVSSSELRADARKPDLNISDLMFMDPANHLGPLPSDTLSFKIENSGDDPAYISAIYSSCSFVVDGAVIPLEKYVVGENSDRIFKGDSVKGCKLESINVSENKIPSASRSELISVPYRFCSDQDVDERLTVNDVIHTLSEDDVQITVVFQLLVKYKDSSGNISEFRSDIGEYGRISNNQLDGGDAQEIRIQDLSKE